MYRTEFVFFITAMYNTFSSVRRDGSMHVRGVRKTDGNANGTKTCIRSGTSPFGNELIGKINY